MIAKRAALIAALIAASAPANAVGLGEIGKKTNDDLRAWEEILRASADLYTPHGFDLDGGKCDWQGAYAYFNYSGMVEVEPGPGYKGGGHYYIPEPEAVTVTEGDLIRYQVIRKNTDHSEFWLVHPEGYITQSEAYDANTILTEGAADVLKLTPCVW